MKETEATNHLEKKLKANPQFSFAETVQAAIAALQAVLSEDFKASEIEARGYAQSEDPLNLACLGSPLRWFATFACFCGRCGVRHRGLHCFEGGRRGFVRLRRKSSAYAKPSARLTLLSPPPVWTTNPPGRRRDGRGPGVPGPPRRGGGRAPHGHLRAGLERG